MSRAAYSVLALLLCVGLAIGSRYALRQCYASVIAEAQKPSSLSKFKFEPAYKKIEPIRLDQPKFDFSKINPPFPRSGGTKRPPRDAKLH